MKDAVRPFVDSVGLRDQEHGHRALPVQILVERREGAGPNEGEGLALTVREIEARVLGRAWWVAEERRAEFAVQHELPERLLHGLPTHHRPPLLPASSCPAHSASVSLQPPPSVL